MKITRFIIKFTVFYAFIIFGVWAEENPRFYLGKNHHYINWQKVETKNFLDYDLFIEELKKEERDNSYDMENRDLNNHERVGLVLKCINDCMLLKGNRNNRLRYLSSVREGDEVLTNKQSYMWIFLVDGTMVRLSPETSLSINEINIGRKKNFILARLNYGNLLWLGRDKQVFAVKDRMETDRLFLPLKLRKANRYQKSIDLHFSELNDLIKKNNVLVSKDTDTFLIMPNGSVLGTTLSGEFTSLFNGKSYFKLRDYELLGLISKGDTNKSALFHYRGHNNTKTTKLKVGVWYGVGKNGEKLEDNAQGKFSLGEIITKNIPTIMKARELMFQKFSLPLFSSLSKKAMGEKFGYRIWKQKELDQRLAFIKDYTRRLETTQLKVLSQFWDKKKNFKKHEYDNRYFSKAMGAYATKNLKARQRQTKKILLNSEKKPFWKVINEQ